MAIPSHGSAIHTRALLVWLTISTWSARKYDKQITAKVNADLHASSDAGRYNKTLLPGDAVAYKTLVALAGSIRASHYGHTLAWSDEGWRLLPTSNYMDYTAWFREQQNQFADALSRFVSEYPTLRAQAQSHLNGAYRAEDYPDSSDIRKRFQLQVQYSPVPAQGDIRVDLATDQISLIESTITDRIDLATRTAMQDAWTRLYTCVSHISERLNDPKAVFRDSLIGNAREICDSLRRLNVTNDPDLDTMRARVEQELTSHDPDILRDEPAVRAQTAARADAIMSAMSGLYGGAL